MAITYDPIASQILGSNQSTVTFSSIAASWTDLVLVVNAKASGTATITGAQIYFNSDTNKANYAFTAMYGTGSTYGTFAWGSGTSQDHGPAPLVCTATNFCPSIVHINNYYNSTIYKPALSRSGDASGSTYLSAGIWLNTSTINSITIYGPDSGTYSFVTGSYFGLFGIKAA